MCDGRGAAAAVVGRRCGAVADAHYVHTGFQGRGGRARERRLGRSISGSRHRQHCQTGDNDKAPTACCRCSAAWPGAVQPRTKKSVPSQWLPGRRLPCMRSYRIAILLLHLFSTTPQPSLQAATPLRQGPRGRRHAVAQLAWHCQHGPASENAVSTARHTAIHARRPPSCQASFGMQRGDATAAAKRSHG